jgi:hypothetical protein
MASGSKKRGRGLDPASEEPRPPEKRRTTEQIPDDPPPPQTTDYIPVDHIAVPGPTSFPIVAPSAAAGPTETPKEWHPVEIRIHCDHLPEPLTGLAAIEETHRLAEIADAKHLAILASEENLDVSDKNYKAYDSLIGHRSFNRRVDELECLLGIKATVKKNSILAHEIPDVIASPDAPHGKENTAKKWYQLLVQQREMFGIRYRDAKVRLGDKARSLPELFDGREGSTSPEALLEEYYHRCICAEGFLRILRDRCDTSKSAYKSQSMKRYTDNLNEELAKYRQLFGEGDELIRRYKDIVGKELPRKSDGLDAFLKENKESEAGS